MLTYKAKLREIYNLIINESNEILYQHNYPYLSSGEANPIYRAVIRVTDDRCYKDLERLIAEAQCLHYEEKKHIERLVADAHYPNYEERQNGHRLPINLPRFLNGNSVCKIQIHENKAYSSLNYRDLDQVPVMRESRKNSYLVGSEDLDTRKNRIKAAFKKAGYTVNFAYDDHLNIMETLTIDAKTLCEKFECDSIQHRIQTGVQIRGNFFIQDEQQCIVASPLQSIGVLLLRVNQNIDVFHSYKRRTRSDAKFTDGHPDEIILKIDNLSTHYGRLYRCFDTQK